MLESELDHEKKDNSSLREELLNLWEFVHDFIEQTRGALEHNKPGLYKTYDDACLAYGETSRQVTIT